MLLTSSPALDVPLCICSGIVYSFSGKTTKSRFEYRCDRCNFVFCDKVCIQKLKMDEKEIIEMFKEKAEELANSRFSSSLEGSGVTVRFDEKGIGYERKGPDYEAVKSFGITMRNFMLDSDPISIANMNVVYSKLDESNELKAKFMEAREKFNEFLDSNSIFEVDGKRLTNREVIEIYTYGDNIHLNRRREFKKMVSTGHTKEMMFNELVYVFGNAANFVYYFDALNREYVSALG